MPRDSTRALSGALAIAGSSSAVARGLWSPNASVALADLSTGTTLEADSQLLRGRSVLVRTETQLAAALALLEVDGIARRVVLCPPDLASEHLPYVIDTAEVDALVTDRASTELGGASVQMTVRCTPNVRPGVVDRSSSHETEWILFTSGTTGRPKMVVHSLASLAGAITPGSSLAAPLVWATFYDIRRYGGLQILLRALLGGGSLVLSGPDEPVPDFLMRAQSHAVTHITGTPSHWRKALMFPAARCVTPQYARLSGEIADQAIIDHLRSFYSNAKVGHAFASTEAGVAFEVNDGLAGFPANYIGRMESGVDLKVAGDTLHIRSPRTARRYLGNVAEVLLDADGFVDTGDVLDLRGDRYHFVGRRGGIINVGGLKIHPEEVEAVINRHPGVRMSLVKARKNPITGAIVAAEVVPVALPEGDDAVRQTDALKAEILEYCRSSLAPHKVPAAIRFVPSLDVTPSGKIVRRDA
jgi:acyl-coenzyme A synthetase/AMP-(fatty) acid ligase